MIRTRHASRAAQAAQAVQTGQTGQAGQAVRAGRVRRVLRTRRIRRRVALALRWTAFVCVLGLLAACASMPSGGGVREVSPDDAAGTEADEQQVRVFGVPPQPNESPRDLVDGFLEALTSDEPGYQTAREYLTPEASATWLPEAGIKIVDKTPNATVTGFPAPDATSTIVSVDSKQVGSVDDQFAYEPRPFPKSPDSVELSLVKNGNGQWRIAQLPNGLMLSVADFQRIYTPVSMYWFTDSDKPMLVPDPIYLRTRNALVTTLVKKLLRGPNKWIAPVVRTSIPPNTELLDHTVSIDDSGYVVLKLSGKPNTMRLGQCEMLGSQLLYTLSQVAKVESVELKTDDGSLCPAVSKQTAAAFDPAAPDGAAGATGYFLTTASGVANMVRAGSEDATQVPGQFGDNSMHLNEIAVDRNEQRIAGTTRNDLELWVSGLDGKTPAEKWATAEAGHTFKSLTWDGRGGLWLLEEDNATSRRTVYWVDRQSKIPVPVEGLEGGRIVSIRMSPDGTRASLFVEHPDEGQVVGRMVMGRVNRGVDAVSGEPRPVIDALRLVMPDVQEVKSQSWQGASRILVLGRPQDASSLPLFVDIDGSNVVQISSPSGVESIAAPDGRDQPLLAGSSDELIYRQDPGGAWKALPGKGRHFPVYPG